MENNKDELNIDLVCPPENEIGVINPKVVIEELKKLTREQLLEIANMETVL